MEQKRKFIRLDQVVATAKRKENENLRFRSFLKRNAKEDDLGRRFAKLHQEIFAHYDCSKCRNCCKLLSVEIPEDEVDRDAVFLGIPRDRFIEEYLEQDMFGNWVGKYTPCVFLNPDGSCTLGDHRPENCKKYPYTDQPERLQSLYSF
ncbi:MAG: YkgJ family cysteine cluster protein [Oscillospiraceae bacterium]|nr:YkgJ family cysteine cluster protein [Oscillospiraceae bacterium]